MSTVDTRLPNRRAAAREAAETRKKVLLGGLVLVLVVLLAFELPKLMHRSSSSSTTAATPAATAASPAVAAGHVALASASANATAKRVRAIRRMHAKDPFVPLLHESTTTSASTPAPAATPAPAPAPAPAAAPVTSQPAITFTPSVVSSKPVLTKPVVTKPVRVKPAAPTAAVIWTNGRRQLVGLGQEFKIGQVQFRLVAVTRKAVRLKIVGAAFANGKATLTARKGHHVKLTNTATGIEYGLLFTAASSDAPTTTTGNS
jgi:hypothetical protein